MSLQEVGAITGVGKTRYFRGTDRTALSFQLEASLNAIRDAGLKPSDIDGLISYGHGAVAEDFITNFAFRICDSPPPPRWAARRLLLPSNTPWPSSRPASATTC